MAAVHQRCWYSAESTFSRTAHLTWQLTFIEMSDVWYSCKIDWSQALCSFISQLCVSAACWCLLMQTSCMDRASSGPGVSSILTEYLRVKVLFRFNVCFLCRNNNSVSGGDEAQSPELAYQTAHWITLYGKKCAEEYILESAAFFNQGETQWITGKFGAEMWIIVYLTADFLAKIPPS